MSGESSPSDPPPVAPASVARSRRWWIVGAAIAAIAAVIVVGVTAIGDATVASARADYEDALVEYSALLAERDRAEATALEVLSPEVSDPADDPTLLDQIARLLEIVQQVPSVDLVDVDRTSDLTTINDGRSALEAVVAEFRTDVDALAEAVDALLGARVARAIDSAITELDRAIAEGETALEGSEGRVSDESVRTTLSAALDTGRSERDAEERDLERIAAATAAIRTAISEVAAVRAPAFTDVNGTWCYWENISFCVTISLPRVGDDSVIQTPGADSFYPLRGDGWTYVVPGEPCFTTGVGAANGDPFGSAVFVYCPRGVSSKDPFQNFNNPQYERIYISQQGSIDPYFRIEEWSAATGR